ncbi:hypothetical protein EVAR_102824_1 [Eumeta japonica]|uniref:Uncharacterized protein n=1 Tax=Eumeta variegata TaxID=151549 RepID=A0A4C1TKN0_EUMVA|nr:hypothetical protein EVAR_102824_1 [Eumeta japonica]
MNPSRPLDYPSAKRALDFGTTRRRKGVTCKLAIVKCLDEQYFLRIFELADTIKLALDDLGRGKESKHTPGSRQSSASPADAEGFVFRFPTLSLTQFSG